MNAFETPAFALSFPVAQLNNNGSNTAPSRPNPAQHALAESRKRARQLMYGAGGAFRGLNNRRQQIEQMVRMSGGRFTGGFNGWGNGGGDANGDEGDVDPSWGVAPCAHVLLRNRADEAYRLAVANLIAMSVKLTPKPGFADPSVPIVIILGWMGARQKQLKKYAAVYEELGYEVHCFYNDLKTAIFPPASKAQAKRIGSVIEDQPEERPVFVHAFSIGTGIYGLLLESLRHETEKLQAFREKVAGVVFDSGPAPIFPNDVAKGLHTVCPMVSKAIWEGVASTFFWATRARNSYGKSEDALRKFQFPSPQLYFYSGDDKVIPNMKNAVEEFIDKNKQRGVEVYNKFWENSIHASHLKVHPEEYLENLQSFLNRCMELREKGLPAMANVK